MTSMPPDPDRAPLDRSDASGGAPKRPRFLVVALVAALFFGAGCWTEGCSRLAFYRAPPSEADVSVTLRDESERARAEALYKRFVETAERARGRAVPLAAATFVLGAALLALASRGLSGRSNPRSALMQVMTAQALVVVVSFFATREMRTAEAEWQYETALGHQREHVPPEQLEEVIPTLRAVQRWAPPGWLVLRTLASALVVVALSRPRSRAFFEAAGDAVSGE